MAGSIHIPPDLAIKRVEALYRHDDHGRLTSINQWNGGTAPRFFVMRTINGIICRFRSDVPSGLIDRLEALCCSEPAGDLSDKLPVRHAEYLELVCSHAPVDRIWAGPVYMC